MHNGLSAIQITAYIMKKKQLYDMFSHDLYFFFFFIHMLQLSSWELFGESNV
jgi:hypothetical protein